MRITRVRLQESRPEERERGLVGWISCVVDDCIVLDGIAFRRTATGCRALSFPARRDAAGRRHSYIRPLDDQARRHIEHQVFAALGLEEESPR